ncbi:uncharacterized protein LOC122979475 [Thunnus albacares]|uniref:uncharacterized protein LOC122979475 n=1 Tax=Thunnus albacares TaxID=8236 RepID=UPI001CF6F4D7|nr:uncharacterized protein LOC122979475 [Thunnus albacares]
MTGRPGRKSCSTSAEYPFPAATHQSLWKVQTQMSEIQELTDRQAWRYVDTQNNPADDITRGKPLLALVESSHWSQGPPFLKQSAEHWPKKPEHETALGSSELKGITFCCFTTVEPDISIPDAYQFSTWKELVEAAQQGVKPIASQKKLLPSKRRNLCQTTVVWPAGGRLRTLQNSSIGEIHPIVLDPRHSATKLLIKDTDERPLHPGTERVYAEIRRQYWILRGRQAVRHHQLNCPSCQRWRAQPKIPQMADLPLQRLRLLCPPFYSTGVDCFGPYLVKVGRRTEKCWGVIFKCLTTRTIHTELLNSMDADAFLLALRRFVARQGRPKEILSDCGTNFRGAERELREAFAAMEPQLKEQLTEYQIDFRFNPPNAPHFGGAWEREVRSIKAGLQVAVGSQAISEDVLHTTLVEVEGILNSKPLGYVSADVTDPDPITPNILLMGRRDAVLPQVAYVPSGIGRRRWRHCQVLVDQFWI